MHKKRLIIAGSLVLAMLAGACNTMEGLGEDINRAGKAISRAADNTRDNMNKH